MDSYINAVRIVLTDSTGEAALGCKIASDLGDCLILDCIENIQQANTIETALNYIMQKDALKTARICKSGLENCPFFSY